jgi:hypothetical protein
MSTDVDLLKGARIQSCARDGESLVLTFISLRFIAHNRWEIRNENGIELDCSKLVGTTVSDVATSDTELVLRCGGMRVEVDLSPSAWSGPEAAVLYVEDRPAVVWS